MSSKGKWGALARLTASAAVSALCLSFSACKKSGTSVVNMPVMPAGCYVYGSNLTGDQADQCCDTSGSLKQPLPAGCPRPNGQTPTTASMEAFGGAANTASRSLAAAEGYVGTGTVAQNNIAAATAGDAPTKDGAKSDSLGNASRAGELAMKAADTRSAPAGGSGSGGASASGLNAGYGSDVRTQAAPGTSADQQQVALAEQSAAMSGSGGGKGRKAGGAEKGGLFGAFDNLFGSAGGGNAASVGMIDVGRAPASGDPSTLGSEDPDDYFSRLKKGESIFKVVERRYTEKARGWATRDATDVAAKARMLVK